MVVDTNTDKILDGIDYLLFRRGDIFSYSNRGRQSSGRIGQIDTHDQGTVGVLYDTTGSAICRIDKATRVCVADAAIIVHVAPGATLVVTRQAKAATSNI